MPEMLRARAGGTRVRLLLTRAILLLGLVALPAIALLNSRGAVGGTAPQSLPLSAASRLSNTAAQERDFAKFSHATPAHGGVACASCHRRETNGAEPRTPGHKACTDCHIQQFVSAPASPMCAICHTNLESSNPPIRAFPRLQSFNVKFDHAQHTSGAGRSEEGCATCHRPMRRGIALSIPATLDAHTLCYQCHTPQAQSGGREIGSCSVCHDLGGYRRTGTGSPAFGLGFSHAAHGARQGLGCASCHNVRAGLAQSRQVSSPRPAQHFAPTRVQSCAACHDNRRAFGGEDFSDCKRCHKGASFRL